MSTQKNIDFSKRAAARLASVPAWPPPITITLEYLGHLHAPKLLWARVLWVLEQPGCKRFIVRRVTMSQYARDKARHAVDNRHSWDLAASKHKVAH
jgi:hypothetical protein